MELVILLILIAAVVLYCMIRGALDEKKQKKLYRNQLLQNYGKYEIKNYTPEQLYRVSRLFRQKEEQDSSAFCLDDITWNDLNMDGIFAQINHTQSSSGAEYLYDMLRHPLLEADGMQLLEKDIEYLRDREEERVNLQMLLHELGTTGRFSLYDYLNLLDNLGKRSNSRHILGILALIVALVMIGISSVVGIFALILVSCFNIVTYLKDKNTVLPYLTSFAYIMRMLDCAQTLLKEPLNGMPEYKEQLNTRVQPLLVMHKHAHLVFQMGSSSGNPAEIILDYIKMLTHIDIIQFNRMLQLVRDHREQIEGLAQAIGYIDTVIAIGAFRESLPHWCTPVLTQELHPVMHMEEGYHPSLHEAVANSFRQERGMLITGSNASGKSTFLKMTAINAILAQTIHTCAARSYQGGCYRIYSSMALRDNLDNGESYYIVEIKALKRIMDAASVRADSPLLCFVDEVLRGTNTIERIAASTQLLHQLSESGAYCFAATHDIELTHLLDRDYDNYHFEEEVKDGDVLFSYRLLNGRAQSRNAIKLLEVIGFSREITNQAQAMAEKFIKTGQWEE